MPSSTKRIVSSVLTFVNVQDTWVRCRPVLISNRNAASEESLHIEDDDKVTLFVDERNRTDLSLMLLAVAVIGMLLIAWDLFSSLFKTLWRLLSLAVDTNCIFNTTKRTTNRACKNGKGQESTILFFFDDDGMIDDLVFLLAVVFFVELMVVGCFCLFVIALSDARVLIGGRYSSSFAVVTTNLLVSPLVS